MNMNVIKFGIAAFLGLVLSLAVVGCTDAGWDKSMGKGKEYTVQLYSGGELIRSWTSTGKVLSEASTDGYYFRDKETKKLTEVSGTIVITVK